MDNFDFRGISAIIDEGGLKQEDIFRLIRLQNEMNAFNPLMMSGNGIMQMNQRQHQNYNSNNQQLNHQILPSEFDPNKREQLKKLQRQQQNNVNVHVSHQQPFSQRRTNNNINLINFQNAQTQNQNQQNNQQSQTGNQVQAQQNQNQQTNQGNQNNTNQHPRKRDR